MGACSAPHPQDTQPRPNPPDAAHSDAPATDATNTDAAPVDALALDAAQSPDIDAARPPSDAASLPSDAASLPSDAASTPAIDASPDIIDLPPDAEPPPSACGDGVVDAGEECDPGLGSSACLPTCTCAEGYQPSGGDCDDVDECAVDNGECGDPVLWTCTNQIGAAPVCAEVAVIVLPSDVVTGTIAGLTGGVRARIILGNDGFLVSEEVEDGDTYFFADVPAGEYFLSVQVTGHRTPRARRITVLGPGPDVIPIDLAFEALPPDTFYYQWQEDVSRAGHQETAFIATRPTIEYLGDAVETPDSAAAEVLHYDYNIVLSNEDRPWTQEHVYRLLETMRTIPQPTRSPYGPQALRPSKWVLTDAWIADDVTIVSGPEGDEVTLSQEAFVYATPRLVLLDGVKGTFFSKRLHHALVRYVTDGGNDLVAVERILQERFGCTTLVPDYEALTAATTGDTSASFQAFHASELVAIINMFEEMPHGYHVVPGLSYLVRRLDGTPHPVYPLAPAVAWAWPDVFPEGSYIELMESAFSGDPDHMHRLLIHEKAHFLWAFVFSEQLRQDWTALGGWYEDPADPDGWSTTKTTEFVTAYAHQKNPDEDMAESLSYFILDPAALQSRSMPKFEFIRDRIMHGHRYVSVIPEELTFEVLNLFPDYTYPGKIERVEITVTGAPAADKLVTVEIGLHTSNKLFAGASSARLRLFSDVGTFVDLWLSPTNPEQSVLRGSLTLSRYAKAGFWYTDQIVVTDLVGNQRLEGVDDYGWRLYVDNPLEDLTPPQYVNGTLTLERFDETVVSGGVSHSVQRVRASWTVEENQEMPSGGVYATLTNPSAVSAYSMQSWGTFDLGTSRAEVDFYITEYHVGGTYGVPFVMMYDVALNRGVQYFSSDPEHQPLVTIPIVTTNPDTTPPEVSLNDVPELGLHAIQVSAEPTHPEAPDGETLVEIRYQARDDLSGLGVVSYRLLDPQGISHHQFHYHPNFYSLFFEGDPTAWAEYEIHVVLPPGSPPGIWGLQELVLEDKVGNRQALNFVETVHFIVAE